MWLLLVTVSERGAAEGGAALESSLGDLGRRRLVGGWPGGAEAAGYRRRHMKWMTPPFLDAHIGFHHGLQGDSASVGQVGP